MTKNKKSKTSDEYDTPWKDVLATLFPEFVSYYFPHIGERINWNVPPVFRDKELSKVMRGANTGNRFADKVAELRTLTGEFITVFVHVEVQVSEDTEFEQRMYTYNSRLCEIFGNNVVSLALLADNNPSWLPSKFTREFWGSRTEFSFESVKLVNLPLANELPQNTKPNPFQYVTLAHLAALRTSDSSPERLLHKKELLSALYTFRLPEAQQHNVLKFLDWILFLTGDIELECNKFQEELEKKMGKPYVFRAARGEFAKGEAKMVAQALEVRLNDKSQDYVMNLSSYSEEQLQALHHLLLLTTDTATIQNWFDTNPPKKSPTSH